MRAPPLPLPRPLRPLFLPLLVALAGCTTTPAPSPASWQEGTELELAVGQSALLPDGTRLRHAGLHEDSRCPPAVQCIRAGEASIRVELTRADGSRQAGLLHTGQPPRGLEWNGYTVSLVALGHDAQPVARLRLDHGQP